MGATQTASPAEPELTDRLAATIFWTLLTLMAGVIAFAGPVATSDGPAHVVMAHAIVVKGDPAWPMVSRLYDLSPVLTPNALGHYLLAVLMLVVSPAAAETILQILCVVSVPLAGLLVLRRLNAGRSWWLALFLFPVALQRMFFMGLYNYCLSVAGCLLSLWAYLLLRERLSVGGALRLGALLLLTLACQAAGWLEAMAATGTLVVVETAVRLHAGVRPASVVRLPASVAVAAAPGVLLFAWFSLRMAGSPAAYGPSPLVRLMNVLLGAPFAPIGRETAVAALVVTVVLALLVLNGLIGWLRGRDRFAGLRQRDKSAGAGRRDGSAGLRQGDQSAGAGRRDGSAGLRQGDKSAGAGRRDGSAGLRQPDWLADDIGLRIGMVLVPAAFLLLLMIIPDRAGGGWTHTWRAEPLPFVGLILACAVLPVARWSRRVAMPVAAAAAAVSVGMMAKVQILDVPPALRDLRAIDALIPPHCSVAPVFAQFKLDPDNTARLFHHPLFHAANRIELRDDRPVLFSYVARLPVYPVRFAPSMDPQRLLFGWEPFQSDTRIYTIDIPAFEAAAGMTVDYLLLGDVPPASDPGKYSALRQAVAASHYAPVYRSPDGRLELFRRPGPDGCAKP